MRCIRTIVYFDNDVAYAQIITNIMSLTQNIVKVKHIPMLIIRRGQICTALSHEMIRCI